MYKDIKTTITTLVKKEGSLRECQTNPNSLHLLTTKKNISLQIEFHSFGAMTKKA